MHTALSHSESFLKVTFVYLCLENVSETTSAVCAWMKRRCFALVKLCCLYALCSRSMLCCDDVLFEWGMKLLRGLVFYFAVVGLSWSKGKRHFTEFQLVWNGFTEQSFRCRKVISLLMIYVVVDQLGLFMVLWSTFNRHLLCKCGQCLSRWWWIG